MRATADVVRALSDADVALWTSWMEAVRSISADPYGIEVRRVGGLTLLRTHEIPILYYNRILGVTEGEAEHVEDAMGYYRARHSPCRIDINPFFAGPEVLGLLNARGFHPSEFQTNLFAELDEVESQEIPGVRVRRVRTKELGFFARLYEEAYNGPAAPKRLARFRMDSIKARAADPRWRFYMTLVDGVPAGGGALLVEDSVATLAGGATMFTLRGRGCQAALIDHRMKVAAEEGCSLVASRCLVGSASQRNLERAGLRTAYTKGIWEPQPLSGLSPHRGTAEEAPLFTRA